jgi:hypothetical protein
MILMVVFQKHGFFNALLEGLQSAILNFEKEYSWSRLEIIMNKFHLSDNVN